MIGHQAYGNTHAVRSLLALAEDRVVPRRLGPREGIARVVPQAPPQIVDLRVNLEAGRLAQSKAFTVIRRRQYFSRSKPRDL